MLIWKSKIDDDGTCELPMDARLLCVNSQYSRPHVWYETSGIHPTKQTKRILAVSTGGVAPEYGHYLGTILFMNGTYVLHYYDTQPLFTGMDLQGHVENVYHD